MANPATKRRGTKPKRKAKKDKQRQWGLFGLLGLLGLWWWRKRDEPDKASPKADVLLRPASEPEPEPEVDPTVYANPRPAVTPRADVLLRPTVQPEAPPPPPGPGVDWPAEVKRWIAKFPTPGYLYQVVYTPGKWATKGGMGWIAKAAMMNAAQQASIDPGSITSKQWKAYRDLISCANDAVAGSRDFASKKYRYKTPNGYHVSLYDAHADNAAKMSAGQPVHRRVDRIKPWKPSAGMLPLLLMPLIDLNALRSTGAVVLAPSGDIPSAPLDTLWSNPTGLAPGESYGC